MASWKGLAGVDAALMTRYITYPPGMVLVGGLSEDRKILVVADRKTMCGLEVATAKVVWQHPVTDVGIQSLWAMGVGQNVLVAADTSGAVGCVDVRNGNLLWRNKLVGGSLRPAGPPRIGGDLVVLSHNGGKTVTCFSLSKNGRVVGKWKANRWAQCELTGDGLLVVMIDGELTVREATQLDKPLWSRRYDTGRYPAILGVCGEMIALSPRNDGGPVEILSIPGGGRTLATLDPANIQGLPAVSADAHFHEGDLYVICSAAPLGRRKSQYDRYSNCRGLNVQKFSIASEKHLWSRTLADQTQYFTYVPALTFGKDHVVVLAKQYQPTLPSYAYVLDADSGRDAQDRIELRHGAGAVRNAAQLRKRCGSPVMTDGRLCIETVEGVMIYGKR